MRSQIRRLVSEHLELPVVRRSHCRATLCMQVVENRNGQDGPFGRVCSGPQLIEENQAPVSCVLHYLHDLRHVRRKRAEALFDALFVSYVRVDSVEYRHH